MKPKVLFLKGLPASGKSTFAKDFCKKYDNFIRVNKDDIRAMMTSAFSKVKEEIVLAMRDQAVVQALTHGFGVIVDDTNLESKHEIHIRKITEWWNKEVPFEVMFFDEPLSVCLERNRLRGNTVPEDVIISMAKRYGIGKEKISIAEFEPVIQDPTLDLAIIVDIDGTLADNGERNPYDFSRVSEDKPYGDMIELVRVLSETYEIIFVSGRGRECYSDTFSWLKGCFPNMGIELYMRPEGDKRKDSIIKYEILQNLIKENFIAYVLDDRNQVVKMWREAGLRCLQVQEGNF